MQEWILDELKTVDLGDQRLDARLALVLDELSQRPTLSIPAACKGRNEYEAVYRQACAGQAEAPDTQAPCPSDSEGDVYEPLLEAAPEPGVVKARFIVRACQDRCLADDEPAKLFETVAAAPVRTTLTIQVSQ